MRISRFAGIAALALSTSLMGCFAATEREGDDFQPLTTGEGFLVLGVIDVDTLAVDLSGDGEFQPENEAIRMIGLRGPAYRDDPSDPSRKIAEYPAREAVAYLQARLVGQAVVLEDDRKEEFLYRQDPPPEFDVTGDGRLLRPGGPWLAYVYVGDVLVNRDLLDRGYAKVREDVPSNLLDTLRAAEARAQRKKVGVWEFGK
ncbi:MAG: thermonuclease family protein [Planctomycetota bacterium]|jgi:hypothetical protein